ncbi:leucine-rich repeat-containing protein 61-like [Apostichopus japonicus]|uniref:leucine-rich repeat-containing protein 61-like n=1 Tax=Stichopus japonicus TaxID=307972 RepID=UPI003AB3FDEB
MELDTKIVSKQLLKTLSGEFDLESIRFINLSQLKIENLGDISDCICLEKLDASKNVISDVKPLAKLKQLTYLNLAANSISCIDHLEEIESLKTLNLAGNLLGSFDSLQGLTKLQCLESLRFQDPIQEYMNPICQNAFYKRNVLAMFPNLKSLDGERVTGRGSEVFRLLHELERDVNDEKKSNENVLMTSSNSWTSEGFWDCNTVQSEGGDEAEGHLRDLIKECNKLSSSAGR